MGFVSSIESKPNIQAVPAKKVLSDAYLFSYLNSVVSAAINSPDYAGTTNEVWLNIEYNEKKNNPWDLLGRTSLAQVQKIVNAYLNLLSQNSGYPEYIADSSKYQTGQTTQQMTSLLETIASTSGTSIDLTTNVMNQLYYDTVQGKPNVSPNICFPRTHADFGQQTATPAQFANKSPFGNIIDAAGNLVDSAGSIIKTATQLAQEAATSSVSLVKYLPYIVLIGGGTLVVWKWNDIIQSFKGKK